MLDLGQFDFGQSGFSQLGPIVRLGPIFGDHFFFLTTPFGQLAQSWIFVGRLQLNT